MAFLLWLHNGFLSVTTCLLPICYRNNAEIFQYSVVSSLCRNPMSCTMFLLTLYLYLFLQSLIKRSLKHSLQLPLFPPQPDTSVFSLNWVSRLTKSWLRLVIKVFHRRRALDVTVALEECLRLPGYLQQEWHHAHWRLIIIILSPSSFAVWTVILGV